jgi:DNA-binding ferritin-like protein
MPDDLYTLDQTVGTKDPYTGLHAESIYALWHDPSTYDHMTMGPPYLPDMKVRLARSTQDSIRSYVRKVANESPASQIFLHLVGEYQGIYLSELGVLVAVLRAGAIVHQTNHWQTRGDTFYGDHLLFQRLYEESTELVDRVAERAVGAGNRFLVHPILQTSQVGYLVKFFCGDLCKDPTADQHALISFMTEVHTLSFLGMVYSALESSNRLTNGTDNLLQDASDKHEGFVYLLRQRIQPRVDYSR